MPKLHTNKMLRMRREKTGKDEEYMKITLEINDGAIAGFLNLAQEENGTLFLASHQLDSNDLQDGNVIKLPREESKE